LKAGIERLVMSLVNPLTGSMVQAPAAQRIQDLDKARQMRHAQETRKNAAASDEQEAEESVASADDLPPIGDESPNPRKKKGTYSRKPPQPPPEDAEGNGLDLTA
jgi:hypothetical protein